MFRRKPDCDIRVQLPNVSQEHAVVEVEDDKKVGLYQLSKGKKVLKMHGVICSNCGLF